MHRARPTLSLAMVVRNESHHLRQMLRDVAPHVDQIVMVDNGSSDDSREVASTYGAVIIEEPQSSHEEARCRSVANCSGEFILLLDPDERLDVPSLRAQLQVLSGSRSSAWRLDNICYTGHGMWTIVPMIRLLRNQHGLRFEGSFHPRIGESIAGPISRIRGLSIHHYEILGQDRSHQKRRRNVMNFEKDLQAADVSPRLMSLYAIELMALGERESAIEMAIAATEIGTDPYRSWRILADIYSEIGDYDLAAKSYREAIARVIPRHSQLVDRALLGAARCELEAGRQQSAKDFTLQAQCIHPTADGYITLATCESQLGNEVEASNALIEAYLLNPSLKDEAIYTTPLENGTYKVSCTFPSHYAQLPPNLRLAWWNRIAAQISVLRPRVDPMLNALKSAS